MHHHTVFFMAVALVLASAGCQRGGVRVPSARPAASAATVEGQRGKDAVVLDAAWKIDAIAPSAEVKEQTDAQRAAVAAAPAEDVAKLNAQWERAYGDLEKESAAMKAELARERDRFFFWMRMILTGGGALVMALSVAGFFMFGSIAAAFPNIGKHIIGAFGAFGATLFASGIAYDWAYHHKGQIFAGAVIILAMIFTAWYVNRHHTKTAKPVTQ